MSARSPNHQRDVLQRTEAILFVLDIGSDHLLWANAGLKEMLGHAPEHFQQLGEDVLGRVCHPDEYGKIRHSILRWILQGSPRFSGVLRLRHHLKGYVWCALHLFRMKPKSPGQLLCCGLVTQIDLPVLSSPSGIPFLREMLQLSHFERLNKLTSREMDVLSLIAQGNTCAEIATLLGLSFHTVDTYRKILLRKLKMRNMAALAAFAGECGLATSFT